MTELAQFFGAIFFIFGIWCGYKNHHGPRKPQFRVKWKPDDE